MHNPNSTFSDRILFFHVVESPSWISLLQVTQVSVNIREVAAQRPLVGDFSIAQRVQASMSLVVGSKAELQYDSCRNDRAIW